MKRDALRHEFVELIPEDPLDGVLYVSVRYATAVHRCCCGCGREVVTPLTPADWALSFDGETVSLSPSVGNWSLPCQSHYWIARDQVFWAPRWSRARIEAGRARDSALRERVYGRHDVRQGEPTPHDDGPSAEPSCAGRRVGWLQRLGLSSRSQRHSDIET